MASIPYSDLITKWAFLTGIDPAWLAGIIEAESSFRPDIKTWEPKVQQYSYGLGQLLLTTAQSLGYTGTGDGLLDPETNIMWTAQYIAQLSAANGGDLAKVYSAYNSGNPDAYLSSSQVGQNVQRVMAAVESFAGAFVDTAAAGMADAADLGSSPAVMGIAIIAAGLVTVWLLSK